MDSSNNSKSNIITYTEDEAVEFLFNGMNLNFTLEPLLPFKSGLININNIKVEKKVKEPFIINKNDRPGDIDILIYTKDFLFSIAMECKKVKVQTKENGNQSFFKKTRKDISKGIEQAYALSKIGFSISYLTIIVEYDDRISNSFLRSLSFECYKYLYDIIDNHPDYKLNINSFGVYIIEVRQPSEKSIQMSGSIGAIEYKSPIVKKHNKNIFKLMSQYKQ